MKKTKKMQHFTEEYVKFLKETPKPNGRSYSESYINNIKYQINRLKEPITIESVNEFIRKNIHHPSTARALGVFLSWYLYHSIDKKAKKKITDKLYVPPEQSKRYTHWDKILTEEEKAKLCKESPKPFPLIFRFLFDTMLRKAEFLSVKVEDINFDKNQVTLQRIKGGESDLRMFHNTTKQMLLDYLKENDIKKGKVFKFTPYTFWYKVNKIAMQIIGKKFSPHWIRHTEGQLMRDMGADDFSMMQRGGWKDRGVLNIYSRSSVVSKKKAFDNFSKEV